MFETFEFINGTFFVFCKFSYFGAVTGSFLMFVFIVSLWADRYIPGSSCAPANRPICLHSIFTWIILHGRAIVVKSLASATQRLSSYRNTFFWVWMIYCPLWQSLNAICSFLDLRYSIDLDHMLS